MYKIKKVRDGYRGFLYQTHQYSTGLERIGNTTGKWVPKVHAAEYDFVRGWLRNLLEDG